MGRPQSIEQRIMTEDGWYYYCNGCKIHRPEREMVDDKYAKFGKMSSCVFHHNPNEKSANTKYREQYNVPFTLEDDTNRHLICKKTPQDQKEALEGLEKMGYIIDDPKNPVWKQFYRKHNFPIYNKKK